MQVFTEFKKKGNSAPKWQEEKKYMKEQIMIKWKLLPDTSKMRMVFIAGSWLLDLLAFEWWLKIEFGGCLSTTTVGFWVSPVCPLMVETANFGLTDTSTG